MVSTSAPTCRTLLMLLAAVLYAGIALVPVVKVGAADSDAQTISDKKAEELLSQMTPEEKLSYIGGFNSFYIRAVPRLGLPEIKMSDGPMGARNDGQTTSYPGGIALAATWDPAMAQKIGGAMGRDCRSRGVNILLGPAVNIYRSPLCGRNFEYMGEDPFLASSMVSPMVRGIQSQGVLATVKHFACNNQEWDRNGISSEVDERTLEEIYFPAFKAAVQEGGAGCVMTAYNLLNGTHCAESDYLMNQVLKRDWGFKGFVMSDWGAVHDGIKAANAGLDLEMPRGTYMNRARLEPAIADGRVQQAVIDDKVRRILRTIIAAGFLDRAQRLEDIPRNDPENAEVALEGAREALVLLKNNRHTLPLDRQSIKSIAVIGPNASPAVYCGGGSAFPHVFKAVSILEGVRQIGGAGLNVLTSTNFGEGIALAKQADAAVVCVGFNQVLEAEGHDRTFELPSGQVDFIRAVAAVNRKTIVVINSGGGVAWAGWLDKTPAVLQAWYPGQAVGQAVAEVLFGDVNPSGRLPATFEKRFEDSPSAPYYHLRADRKTPYTEGVFAGYRGYDEKKITPEFCFGYGLSYTDFKFGKMLVTPDKIAPDGQATVSVVVKNTGKRAGDEIVQIYTHQEKSSVPRPPKELKGFQRVSLEPGETKTVQITLRADQLGFFDVKTHGFVTEPGTYQLMAGDSSRDIHGKVKLEVTAP